MKDLIEKARRRRAALLESGSSPAGNSRDANSRDGGTTAYRLLDGAGDGLPGVFIDDFEGRWLVSTRDTGFPRELVEARTEACRSIWWKALDREKQPAPEHVWGDASPGPFEIKEHGLRFRIDFAAGYSQGLFLDQRENRARVRDRCAPGDRVLNAFAYTCAFGVAAASAGAATVNVDLSRGYLDWGRQNYEWNDLETDERDFIYGDAFDWLGRFAKRGRTFDGIVLDPPTFSRSDQGGVFRVEKDYGKLVRAAAPLLEGRGWMLCCTNYRGMEREEFAALAGEQLERAGRRVRSLRSLEMPPEYRDEKYLKSLWIELA